MGKHIVKWRPTPGKDIRNEDVELPFPDILDSSSKWMILERIFQMEKKLPISFLDAALMAQAKFEEAMNERRFGYAPGQCHWYAKNFLDWISSQGYHIELTGDEFEPFSGVPNS